MVKLDSREEKMSEYDQRQLHLMSEYIKEFEQGKLKLESLIDTRLGTNGISSDNGGIVERCF